MFNPANTRIYYEYIRMYRLEKYKLTKGDEEEIDERGKKNQLLLLSVIFFHLNESSIRAQLYACHQEILDF